MMTRRGLSVAVSWNEEVVTVADDRNLPNVKKRVIGITYDGKALPLPLTRDQETVQKKLGKLWDIPIKDWPRKKEKR